MPGYIRLSAWARLQGIHRKTALLWAQRGRVPGAVQSASRRWYVKIPDDVAR
jgi:predicted site-specific integrase-resolvase